MTWNPYAQMPQPAYRIPQGKEPGAAGIYAFHNLGRAGNRGYFWRPLVVLAVTVVVYLLLGVILGLVLTLFMSPAQLMELAGEGKIDASSLDLLYVSFGSIALALPVILAAQLLGGHRRWGNIFSVEGRLRWGWMGICFAVAIVPYLLLSVLDVVIGGGITGSGIPLSASRLVAIMVFLLAVVPLQSAAEELFFRGLLMQTVGQWISFPAAAILVQVPFFMAAHGYGTWGLASVGTMAVVAGWLTYQTGGLEAAIGLHVTNNVFASLSLFLTNSEMDPNATGTPVEFISGAIVMLLYAAAIEYLRRRRKLPNRYRVVTPTPIPLI